MSNLVTVTDIKLLSLSEEDVISMLMAEFQLTRRLVLGLAEAVYTKTAGRKFSIYNSFCRSNFEYKLMFLISVVV